MDRIITKGDKPEAVVRPAQHAFGAKPSLDTDRLTRLNECSWSSMTVLHLIDDAYLGGIIRVISDAEPSIGQQCRTLLPDLAEGRTAQSGC